MTGTRPPGAPLRVLILGGTTEASRLAAALAARADVAATLSLAGRTENPAPQPLPTRIGGFGGIAGLAAYLHDAGIDRVVDATHPFAARMSANAAEACRTAGVPLVAFSRRPWTPEPGDRWIEVASQEEAAAALGSVLSGSGRSEAEMLVMPPAPGAQSNPSDVAARGVGVARAGGVARPGAAPAPRRVFLTVGRLGLAAWRAAPAHHYLIRTIDPPDPADLPPDHTLLTDRGPFDRAAETALLADHRIDVLVTKNSGGAATYPKLEAARTLGLPVILIRPPARPDVPLLHDLGAVLAWIGLSAVPASR